MRKSPHRLIILEHIAAEAAHAGNSRVLRQDSCKRRSETGPAPIVGDYQSNFGCFRVGATNVASFRNERCGLIHGGIVDLRDERNVCTMVDHRELAQDMLRELVDRAVKSQPTRCTRQRREECPECVQIRRKDRTNRNVPRVVEFASCYLSAHRSVNIPVTPPGRLCQTADPQSDGARLRPRRGAGKPARRSA